MKVYLTPQFINDLRDSKDGKFVKQVLDHTIDEKGAFVRESNDHRLRGIEDAWIRYASRGGTAYRVIFIRKGESVYLHRAGAHAVENETTAPQDLATALPVSTLTPTPETEEFGFDTGKFLKSCEPEFLEKYIKAMYQVGHHEIVLISPFITPSIVSRQHAFGRFLDRAIEEDTIVTIITRPPDPSNVEAVEDLAGRDMILYFRKDLHAKLYMFDIDPMRVSVYNRDMQRTAILGSSNLTEAGFGFEDGPVNDELCFRLPSFLFDEARRFVDSLVSRSLDYQTLKSRKWKN